MNLYRNRGNREREGSVEHLNKDPVFIWPDAALRVEKHQEGISTIPIFKEVSDWIGRGMKWAYVEKMVLSVC